MPPAVELAVDLRPRRGAHGGEDRLGVGLGVEGIDRAAAAEGIARGARPDQKAGELHRLLARLAAREHRADLEQRKVHEPARLIACRGGQQTGQQVGAQMRHFRADRVLDPHRRLAAAEQPRGALVDEAVGHALVVAERRRGPPRRTLPALEGRQHRLRHAGARTRQRLALEPAQRGDAGDLFDQVGLALHVRAPRGHRRHIAVEHEPQRLQRPALLVLGDVHPHQPLRPRRVQPVGAGGVGGGARLDHMARLAATEVEDQLRRQLKPVAGEGRVHAALEAVAGIRVDAQRPPGRRDPDRLPVGAFKEHVRGRLGHARGLAAHDPGEAFGAVVVGDDQIARAQRIGLAVEREQALALGRAAHHQIARDLARVEDVQRAVEVEGEEVGDVHERRNRPQADGAQPLLQPGGRGAVGHAADQPAGEMRRPLGDVRGDADPRSAVETALDRRHRQRLERPQPARREVAGDAADAQRVGAVGGDLDLDDRVDLFGRIGGQPVGEAVPDLARGQLDDAVVFVAEFQLAFRGHHPVALDAADLADAQRRVDAGHVVAGLGEHDGDPRPRIRRAADDLLFALVGHDPADPQPVGVGVLFGVGDLGQRERGQAGGGVVDVLDLEPEIGQGVGDLGDGGRGVEVVTEPGEGEFHSRTLAASLQIMN